MESSNSFVSIYQRVIPILHEDALNLEKRTAKNAKNAKEERGNHLVQAYIELV
ncbi:MAG: hypothetical protein HWQ35_06040 [Nostoc sp. NMS1]|uniref:hypothetical protein n=1 Tax=unclassified Nostoc TaxID=2593658 RepID=UPI0025EFEF9F|nr:MULTISPECIES: hypothetical protein [unclassified Nostoc]MBN3906123.1 hypothetical protein [Nostoc sp. NMS1]MBN3992350.1 hypothetical protein [Nostoc sp. NMS2]